ncbi:MAG: hypothetical protein KDA75_12000 [Planctomycetaceae bacterium]|nr:hypothetical protein [Planctomycetaceae bacterium]
MNGAKALHQTSPLDGLQPRDILSWNAVRDAALRPRHALATMDCSHA